MPENQFFSLSSETIKALKKNGCRSQSWETVLAAKECDPTQIVNTVFSGDIKLGALNGKVRHTDGIQRESGIFNANLHNVTIGGGCYISNVQGWISNVDIEEDVIVENIGSITCGGESSFGNGTPIDVLNEGGGREIKLSDKTSSQVAYLMALYRHDHRLITSLNQLMDDYSQKQKSSRGFVGKRTCIFHCQSIADVRIGPCATLSGVQRLTNGTVDSSSSAPTYIGDGVIAHHFIVQKGAHVDSGALLKRTLVGEGTKIGNQFSAENSVLFANSEGFHSEVCSLFGGPYTVTHHRSTLLIAGMFSFFNAGSGTNQSNHMYKLGPVHQGILERGCKTGSSSYLLWPSRVGAFSAVVGKHYANFDTADFPFSYVNEEKGVSSLVPGMNFFTVGTLRDGLKWPTRDRRTNNDKLDAIRFEVLSPYTAQKMIRGQHILLELYSNADRSQEYVTYNGISIKRLLLKTCSRYYRMALEKYFGDTIVKRIETLRPSSMQELFTLSENSVAGDIEWVDISGLLCAKPRVESLVKRLISNEIGDLYSLLEGINEVHGSYEIDEWAWVISNVQSVFNADTLQDSNALITVLEKWKTSSIKLLNMVEMDASKEFEGTVRTGFGIDGHSDDDFSAVRGSFESNSFKKQLDEMRSAIHARFDNVINIINHY